jgi:hypothetical protein
VSSKVKSNQTDYQLRQAYGISREQYESMYADQRGCCAICHEPDLVLGVDHNHGSGVVRGLLCRDCNFGLGFFKDKVRLLAAAIVYLEDSDGELPRDFD